MVLDAGSSQVRRAFAAAADKRRNYLASRFASAGVDHIPLQTNQDYVLDLVRFFKMREKRQR